MASDAKAADALARVIEKSDFESMAVVGQFNLGFSRHSTGESAGRGHLAEAVRVSYFVVWYLASRKT